MLGGPCVPEWSWANQPEDGRTPARLPLMCDVSTHNDGAQRLDDKRSTPLYATIAKLSRIQLRREDGQTMTEYGVLLALIAVVVIVALVILGPKIADVFNSVSSNL